MNLGRTELAICEHEAFGSRNIKRTVKLRACSADEP